MNIIFKRINPKEVDKELLQKFAVILQKRNEERRSPLPVNSVEFIMKDLLTPDKPFFKIEHYIAQLDDLSLLGCGYVYLNTGHTNLDRCSFSIYILPEYRNKGIGKKLTKFICMVVPKNIKIITPSIRDYKDETHSLSFLASYLQKIDGKKVLSERTNVSKIKNFDPAEVVKTANEMQKNVQRLGYDIYLVKNAKYKYVPEINYPSYVKMLERLWNDMPTEDATWEDEILTEEHHLAWYKDIEVLGTTIWTFIAVHRKSSKPIGMTETWLESDTPALALQDDTGVLTEHRGNKLGLTLKYQMLARLLTHETTQQVEYWSTGNANSNEHMLKINNILGYKEAYKVDIYEIDRNVFVEYFSD